MTHLEILKSYGYGKPDSGIVQLLAAIDTIAEQAFIASAERLRGGGWKYQSYDEYKEELDGTIET